MSNIITKTDVVNGSKMLAVHYYFESDGVEGELQNYVLLDPRNNNPAVNFAQYPYTPKDKLRLQQVWWSFSWFDGIVSYGDIVNGPRWVLARDTSNYMDFRFFGGLIDVSGQDGTGQVLFTTNGFAPQGSVGTLVLQFLRNSA